MRASVIAAKVVPTLRSLPTTVTLRPASPDWRNARAICSTVLAAIGMDASSGNGAGANGGGATRGITGDTIAGGR